MMSFFRKEAAAAWARNRTDMGLSSRDADAEQYLPKGFPTGVFPRTVVACMEPLKRHRPGLEIELIKINKYGTASALPYPSHLHLPQSKSQIQDVSPRLISTCRTSQVYSGYLNVSIVLVQILNGT